MTLYLIGLGLGDEKDISIKGLEAVKQCAKLYLENYTSILQCSVSQLEKLYGKKVQVVGREFCEQGADKLVQEGKKQDIALLIVGDPFSATTHTEIFKSAKKTGVPIIVINNASILTAIGITGLQLYKFGKTTSLPFPEEQPNVETPYLVLGENQKMGLHTLILLDLRPEEDKFVTVNQALEALEQMEKRKKNRLIHPDLLVIGCARLGSKDFLVKSGKLKYLKKFDFGKSPHCLIIPGKLHFAEEEMLEEWK